MFMIPIYYEQVIRSMISQLFFRDSESFEIFFKKKLKI